MLKRKENEFMTGRIREIETGRRWREKENEMEEEIWNELIDVGGGLKERGETRREEVEGRRRRKERGKKVKKEEKRKKK